MEYLNFKNFHKCCCKYDILQIFEYSNYLLGSQLGTYSVNIKFSTCKFSGVRILLSAGCIYIYIWGEFLFFAFYGDLLFALYDGTILCSMKNIICVWLVVCNTHQPLRWLALRGLARTSWMQKRLGQFTFHGNTFLTTTCFEAKF